MNRQKLLIVSLATAAAVAFAVWTATRSAAPSMPDEHVAAGPNATYRAPDEPVAPVSQGTHP